MTRSYRQERASAQAFAGTQCLPAACMVRIVIVALAVLATPPFDNGVAAAREFRAADIQDDTYPTVQALRAMDQIVTQRTEGRHSIRVFHSRQLGEESQTVEQTRVGAIDINRINVGAMGNVVPLLNILSLPYLFRSEEMLHKAIDGPIGDEILAAVRPFGFVGLAFYDLGARSFYTARRPVRSLPDLAGQRIRIQQSNLMEKTVRALGAVAFGLPYGQVVTGLTTNLIDGAENNWPSYVSAGHYKAAQFYTLTAHVMSPEIVIMSQRAWDELSTDDRTIFRAAARESAKYMRAQWRGWEERSRKQAVDAGVTVIPLDDPAPFAAATAPIRQELSREPLFAPLLRRIEAMQ